MSNHRLPLKTAKDPIGHKFSWLPQFLVNLVTRSGSISLNRDDCRTPMQWGPSINAGFCSDEVEPWLPTSPGHKSLNVRSEQNDQNSLLNCYKSLLLLRKKTPALHSGSLSITDNSNLSKSILSYRRIHNEQAVQIWLNFSGKQIHTKEIEGNPRVLFSTIPETTPIKSHGLLLQPYQGVVLGVST